MYKQKEAKITSFQEFQQGWHEQLSELVHQMTKQSPKSSTNQEQQHKLHTNLIQKFTSHIKEYYRVKSLEAKNDILYIFSAPWSNSMERSLYWIAGWRPTISFHIIYSECGIYFESHITDILNGLRNDDLGDLSPNQLIRLSDLQYETIQQENIITEELSDWQDSVNDIIGNPYKKMERLGEILERADQLRVRTMESLVNLLTAKQTVEFLIGVAHLLFGIRSWGINHDTQSLNG